jgi:hypothetical protein
MNAGYDAVSEKPTADIFHTFHTCRGQCVTSVINWINAPYARDCHPREEHLLPPHVCLGLSDSAAKLVFAGKVAGKRHAPYLWQF